MTDMPDTTNTFDPSHTREPGGERYDDAAGFYVDGAPDRRHQGPRRPASTSAGTPASSRPASPTRPTAAGCR